MLTRSRTIALALATVLALAPATAAEARLKLLASDTAANPDPLPFWGAIDCAGATRHQHFSTGGDPHPTATGAPQPDQAFRRLSVIDGDDVFGERCELGANSRRGPTAFYREGRHRITKISLRLPPSFPLGVFTWQAVMQMKQSGPAANSGGTPVLQLDAYAGRWRLRQSLSKGPAEDSRELWSAPAQVGVWTRFSFNVVYSRKRKEGYVKVAVDLDSDNAASSPGERSGKIRTYTLKVETPGGSGDGVRPGSSIRSHLRAGLYHDDDVSCPAPAGCYVDVDNVQVTRP